MFLRLSDAANLGIHALVYLAEHHASGRPVSTAEAAETFQISANHLSKVLQRLHRAGLVKSVRGPRGGFVLSRTPDRITLLDIYEAIDGKFDVEGHCVLGAETCPYRDCIFGTLVDDVQQRVEKQFVETTLDKMMKK